MWYHSGKFFDQPLKARDLEIKTLEDALTEDISEIEQRDILRIINNLKSIPDDKVAVCSVCYAVYDSRYSYSVCSDSCFRDKFM